MYSCLILGHNLERAIMFLNLLKKANRDRIVVSSKTHFVTRDQGAFFAYGINKVEDLDKLRGHNIDYVFIDDDLKYTDYFNHVKVGAMLSTRNHSLENTMYFDLDELIKGGLI